MKKDYEIIFWKVVKRIINKKRDLNSLVFEIEKYFLNKNEEKFFEKTGKLIIEMNHLNTAFEGIERLFSELFKDNIEYKKFKKQYEKLMQLIIKSYEKRNMVELNQYVKILKENYFKESYSYLKIAFRKEGAYVL